MIDDRDPELLATACRAMADGGDAALDALGWWDLLGELDDLDARTAVLSVFRAQGRELASSPALGGLLAVPYLERAELAAGAVAAVPRASGRRGPVWTVVGDVGDRLLLLDEPGRGLHVLAPGDVSLLPVAIPGRLVLHEVAIDLRGRRPLAGDDAVAPIRARRRALGRVAAASEMLGAAERAVTLAVEHAGLREQFGQPIGTFQAVRHLLAWARTDCTAIAAVVHDAIRLLDDLPPRFDEVVKALAGRNGRRACERSLQVLGGVGFTAEHDHHHLHSRVLALDAVLGSSAELTHALGHWLRTSATDPGYPAAILVPGS